MPSPSATPFLSVVVPVYNALPYVHEALDSLAAQTFGDFEVLLIDDGSTDGSLAALRERAAADARLQVVAKENEGYGATVNRGIAQARGTYVGIFEPDDVLHPHAFETLCRAAQETGADVVKANYWFYWTQPRRDRLVRVVRPEWAGRTFSAADEPDILTSIPSIWSAVYRRAFLQQEGVALLETPGASYQDLGFSFKAFACARSIHCLGAPVLHYRQDNAQSSVNSPGKAFAVCAELDAIDAFVAARPERAWMAPYAYRLRYDSYMWNFERLDAAGRAEFLPRLFEDLAVAHAAGAYDPALFGSWQRANLQLVLDSPEQLLQRYPLHPTRAAKAAYYLRLAGPAALLSALRR